VFEKGVFRPLRRREGLAEHRHVTLTVDVEEAVSPLADLAGSLSAEDARRCGGPSSGNSSALTREW
jgi:hypothetical protein